VVTEKIMETIEVDKDLFRIAVRALEMRVATDRAWEMEIEALEKIEELYESRINK
jgi:hypothetical protein